MQYLGVPKYHPKYIHTVRTYYPGVCTMQVNTYYSGVRSVRTYYPN